MIIMMLNCFCGMSDGRKTFILISSRDHGQRSSPSRIFGLPKCRIWTCAEPEFWLGWMKLCSSDNIRFIWPVTYESLVLNFKQLCKYFIQHHVLENVCCISRKVRKTNVEPFSRKCDIWQKQKLKNEVLKFCLLFRFI